MLRRARPRLGVRILTSQPPTLEELFLRHYGDEVAAEWSGSVTGLGVLLRAFARRDRWWYLWWGAVGRRPLRPRAERRRSLHDAGGVRPGRRQHGGQPRLHRHGRPGPGAEHDRRAGGLAVRGLRGDLLGLMSMFIIGRHTSAEEESGRDELLRCRGGRPLRHDRGAAAARSGERRGGVLVASEPAGLRAPRRRRVRLGLGLLALGWSLQRHRAGRGAAARLRTRSAYGLAGAVLGLAYGLRAIGDVGNGRCRWLSPIGWYQAMHAFSGSVGGPPSCSWPPRSWRAPRRRRVRAPRRGFRPLADPPRARSCPCRSARGATASPGGSSAPACSPGRLGSSSEASRTARSARTSTACSATRTSPRTCSAPTGRTWSTRSTAARR